MISIIIPVYNEEHAIAETINQCRKVLTDIGNEQSEIIIVDDASTDKTLIKADQAGVKIIKHQQNLGYGKSLKDGIVASSNDIILITDADGTYPIESSRELMKALKNNHHMAVGERQWNVYKEPMIKRVFRKILNILFKYASGKKVPDVNSGLRMFFKTDILPFLPDLCDRFSFTTSLSLSFLMTGKSVVFIPIEYHKRIGKTKVKHFRDSFTTLAYIVKAINKYNPGKLLQLYFVLMIVIGIVTAVISFFCLSSMIFWAACCCAFFSALALLFVIILPGRKNNKKA